MRLLEYLKFSINDDKINHFRSLKIRLKSKETENKRLVKEIQDKYNISIDCLKLLEDLNKYLRKSYKGKFRFDFCIEEDKKLEDIKMNEKKTKNIKLKFYEITDKFSATKTELEKIIKYGG